MQTVGEANMICLCSCDTCVLAACALLELSACQQLLGLCRCLQLLKTRMAWTMCCFLASALQPEGKQSSITCAIEPVPGYLHS